MPLSIHMFRSTSLLLESAFALSLHTLELVHSNNLRTITQIQRHVTKMFDSFQSKLDCEMFALRLEFEPR